MSFRKMSLMASGLMTLVLIFQIDVIAGVCNVAFCDSNHCEGNTCSKCQNDLYHLVDNASKCEKCLLICLHCGDTFCYQCNDNRCPHAVCYHTNCTDSCKNVTRPCAVCPDGFYNGGFSKCKLCKYNNCKCNAYDNCIGCLPGKYDVTNFCQSDCQPGCVECSNGTQCTECFDISYGSACDYMCPENCKYKTCDIEEGTCNNGCAHGYWDQKCDRVCPSNCIECDQFNSSCSVCQRNFHGTRCEGCVDGYWGQTCDKSCERGCKGNQCHAITGECLIGCKDYYEGTYCNTTANITTICHDKIQNTKCEQPVPQTSSVSVGAIVGLGVAVVILAVSITANIVMLKRVRTLPVQKAEVTSTNTTSGDPFGENLDAHNYLEVIADPIDANNYLELSDEPTDAHNYQELNESRNDDRPYSKITHEYENESKWH